MSSTEGFLNTGGKWSFLKLYFSKISNFSCGFCNLIFPSNHVLNLHKEDSNHWSDDDFDLDTDSEEEEEDDMHRWREIDSLL